MFCHISQNKTPTPEAKFCHQLLVILYVELFRVMVIEIAKVIHDEIMRLKA